MSRARWQREVPEAIRSLDTIDRPDYADLFTVTAERAPGGPAERWVRETVDGAPQALRRAIVVVQRSLLGLRLARHRSPDHLLGWRIAAREQDWLRIEAASWFMTAHCVFHADDRRLSLAAFIRYDRPIAALVWPPVCLIHRQAGLMLMRRAAGAA